MAERRTILGCFATWLALLASTAPAQTQDSALVAITSFNGGYVSPLLQGRLDYPKYQSALRLCSNMIPLVQGPVTRRPGTEFIHATYSSSTVTRLIPFEYSTSDAYALAFGDLTMQVYRGGGIVQSGGIDYHIHTPFAATEVNDVQYAQNANVMYLVHGDHPPQKLTRSGHAAWAIADVNITTGPFLAQNESATKVTPSATTGTITLDADANLWTADYVGALWRITYPVEANSTGKELIANAGAYGTRLLVRPNQTVTYYINTTADWNGLGAIQRSEDGTNWLDYIVVELGTSQTTTDSFINDADTNMYYRWAIIQWKESGYYGRLSTVGMDLDGVVRIESYVDANEVTATVLHELAGTTATTKWAEGAWSDYRGWPRTVQFYEQRLVFGGSASYPQTLWFSKTADGSADDYENMTTGDVANDAMIYALPGQNPIEWLHSQTYLMVGTSSSIGRVGKAEESLTAITPPAFRLQAKQGSAYMQAQTIADSLVFIERGGRKVRELKYSVDTDTFVAPELTALAQDITTGGIRQVAVQNRPETILWSVLGNGHLTSLTYRKEHDVVAWADHTSTNGAFESISVIPGADEDEVWAVVRRTISGSTARYVERLKPFEWGSDANDCWYVDSGLSLDVNAPATIYTVSKAATATITLTTGPYVNGDQVEIAGVLGMTQLNGNIYTLKDRTLSGSRYTYSLYDSTGTVRINTAGFGTYASGGTTQRVENTFAGLSHLDGQTVTVWGNGTNQGSYVVTSGTVGPLSVWLDCSLPVVIGLSYTSQFETLPLMRETGGGLMYPNKKRPKIAAVDLYQSIYPEVSADGVAWVPLKERNDSTGDESPSLFSGFREVSLSAAQSRTPTLSIRQAGPNPLTVRGMAITLEVRSN